MCKKSDIFIVAHYLLAISLKLFIARSQGFQRLDEVIEERIEEEFIDGHWNDMEMIQDSIRDIDTNRDQVRMNETTSLFFQTVKKLLSFKKQG